MNSDTGRCPLCSETLTASPEWTGSDAKRYRCFNCGTYLLTGSAEVQLLAGRFDPAARARISHGVWRMQTAGGSPTLGSGLMEQLAGQPLPSAREQVNSLLLFLGTSLPEPGSTLDLSPSGLRAKVGAITTEGASWSILSCQRLGFVEGIDVSTISEPFALANATLTVAGWDQFEELQRAAANSRLAFMAMQFGDPETDEVYKSCFRPAVQAAGFELRRLDEDPQAGLIDDRLRVEIRRSAFLLADLTHANKGAYWEAGYAEGLGRPVIYTCRSSTFRSTDRKLSPHFDTNHHLTVVWDQDNLKAAAEQLTAVIRATLPDLAKLE